MHTLEITDDEVYETLKPIVENLNLLSVEGEELRVSKNAVIEKKSENLEKGIKDVEFTADDMELIHELWALWREKGDATANHQLARLVLIYDDYGKDVSWKGKLPSQENARLFSSYVLHIESPYIGVDYQ